MLSKLIARQGFDTTMNKGKKRCWWYTAGIFYIRPPSILNPPLEPPEPDRNHHIVQNEKSDEDLPSPEPNAGSRHRSVSKVSNRKRQINHRCVFKRYWLALCISWGTL